MSITTGRKAEVIKTYATKAGDTGSSSPIGRPPESG